MTDDNGRTRPLIEHYANVVRERSLKRQLLEASLRFADSCTNGHTPEEMLAESMAIHRLSMSLDPTSQRRCEPTDRVFERLTQEIAAVDGRGLQTHISEVDGAIHGGIIPGEVLTVIARPRVGKSAVASQIAVNAATHGVKTVFFSLEMPKTQALLRMVQQALSLPAQDVEEAARASWNTITPRQTELLRPLQENVVIIDRAKSNIAMLDASLSEASSLMGGQPRLVVIDYLGLLSTGSRNVSLYQRISEAAIDVKDFAKRNDAAVVLLSQAGRDQDEDRSEGAGPLGLDSARDSGQVEEASDFILTMWRPELSKKLKDEQQRNELRRQAHFALVKNRRGSETAFRLLFERDSTLRFLPWGDQAS